MPKPYDHHVKSAQGPGPGNSLEGIRYQNLMGMMSPAGRVQSNARTRQPEPVGASLPEPQPGAASSSRAAGGSYGQPGRQAAPAAFKAPDLSRRMSGPDFAEVEVDGRVRRVYGEPEVAGQVRQALQENQQGGIYERLPGGAPAMQNRFPVSYGTPQIRMEMPDGRVATRGGSAYAEYDPGNFTRYNDPERAYLSRTEGQGMVPYYGIDVNDPGNRRRMSLGYTRSGTPEVSKDPIPQGPPLPWEPGGREYEVSRNLAEFDRITEPQGQAGYSADPGLVESPYPELRGQGLKTQSEWNALKRQQDWISKTQAQSPLARTYGNYAANLANMTGIPQLTPGGELEADPYHMDPAARWGAWMAAPVTLLAPELLAGKLTNVAPLARNPWMEGLTATRWAQGNPVNRLIGDAVDMAGSSLNPAFSFNQIQNRNLAGIWDASKGLASGGMNLGGRALGTNAFTSGAGEGIRDAMYYDRNNPLATDVDFARLMVQGMARPMTFAPGVAQLAAMPAAMFGNRGEQAAQQVAQQGGMNLPGTSLLVPMSSENLQAIAERGASPYQRLVGNVMGAASPFSRQSGPREQRDLDAYAAEVEQGGNDFAMGLARQASSDPASVVQALNNPDIGPRVRAAMQKSLRTNPRVVAWLGENRPEVLEALFSRPGGAN